jgi:hypothetical protein
VQHPWLVNLQQATIAANLPGVLAIRDPGSSLWEAAMWLAVGASQEAG